MNRYDERYEFRLAIIDEIDKIMQWIDMFWKKGHIMSLDRNLFEYEFRDGNKLNIVLAIDKYKNSIEGLQGIIKYSFGDKAVVDIAGSFLKVLPDNIPMLGVELIKRVLTLSNCRYFCSIGSNPRTAVPIYESVLKCNTAKMQHYYLLNHNITQYNIAMIKKTFDNSAIRYDLNDLGFKICKTKKEIDEEICFDSVNTYPYKDSKYIEKRFIKYPYYDYQILLVKYKHSKCLIIYRIVDINNSKVMRIVDFYGDQLVFGCCNTLFIKLMNENHFEYIDMYCLGFSKEYLYNAGFKLMDEFDPNIIPNYFEPFIRENIDIYAVYNSPSALFFKADGDQDRPSFVKKYE